MSDFQPEKQTLEIMERAEQLVREAQQSQEAFEERLRAMGLDPEKVRATLDAQPLNDAQRQEAQQQFNKDMEEVQREVEQEAAYLRQRSTPQTSTAGRRVRTMV